MESIYSYPQKFLTQLSKSQSFIVIVLIIIATVVNSYYKTIKENEVVTAINNLGEIILEREVGAVSKAGAIFIYTKTFSGTARDIRMELSDIIKQNNIKDPYRQIEVRDLLNHRVKYFCKMDYVGLNNLKYNGVPLSYALKEIVPERITEVLTEYTFSHINDDHIKMTEALDKILDKIFNDHLTRVIDELDKV